MNINNNFLLLRLADIQQPRKNRNIILTCDLGGQYYITFDFIYIGIIWIEILQNPYDWLS